MTSLENLALLPPPAKAPWMGPPTLGTALGLALRTLQRPAPALAARFALARFCRPWPRKTAARAQPVGPGWRLTRWPFERSDLITWQRQDAAPNRSRVLLVHGWAGDAQVFGRFAAALSAAGMEPVMIDMPAHGRSDGAASTLAQWSRALQAMATRIGPLHAAVGHSLGALAVAHAASRGLAAGRLVLLAPCLPPRACLRAFAQGYGLDPAFALAMQAELERREQVELAEFEPERLGAAITQPTLVLHDRADRIAPFSTGLRLALALPGGRLRHVDGIGHRGLLQEAEGISPVVAELTAGRHAPLPEAAAPTSRQAVAT